jgi:tRNA-uridine 2-sulfurtransferase
MMTGTSGKRVVVAMSGGVDSSVTAALLKEQGYEVIGISLQLWDHSRDRTEGPTGGCCSLDDLHDARRVAEQIGIPFYVVNAEEEFRRLVVDDFVSEYFSGRTPNPCTRCNERVKFGLLLERARELGSELLATGHYARTVRDEGGRYRLLTGLDGNKDQSYFLFTLNQEQLSRTLFPVGGLTKPEVRALAQRFALRTAAKGESQEVCFIPDDDYVRFLEEEREPGLLSGAIVDLAGNVLGHHQGIYRYTVGQRRGLGIAHPHPLHVLGVNVASREVIVGPKDQLPQEGLTATDVNWIVPPETQTLETFCRIRYRHRPVPCVVTPLPSGGAEVRFVTPEPGVTPGQAVVFYDGETVLGGGWISGATAGGPCNG